MACWTQQGLILGYHIHFEAITSSNDKDILCNLLNKLKKVLEVKSGHVFERSKRSRRIKSYIVEQKVKLKGLKLDLKLEIKFEGLKSDLRSKVRIAEILGARVGE